MPDIKTNSDLVPSARAEGDAVILSVRGEVDLHNSPELRTVILEVLRDYKPRKLIVNLSMCPYMDSSAIAVLVETMRKLGKGNVFLTHLQPRVKGLVEIARLHTVFVLAESDEDALKK